MEMEDEITERLSSENLELLLNEVRTGKIKEKEVKRIALRMHGNVHGIFVEKIKKSKLDVVFMYMIDGWYNEVIYHPEVNARNELKKILRYVKLNPLAAKINLGHLKDDEGLKLCQLPEKHHVLDLPAKQEINNRRLLDTDQSEVECLSQCVGKAMLEILAAHQYDSHLQDIIDALMDEVGQCGEVPYPDQFNNKSIKVKITKEDHSIIQAVDDAEINILIKVVTHLGEVATNYCLKTVPIIDDSGEKDTMNITNTIDENFQQMILHLDIGMPLTPLPHVIFAKDYDRNTGNYSCIEVSGASDEVREIHNSRVLAVSSISCRQMS